MHFKHISAKIQPKIPKHSLLDLSSARQHFIGGGRPLSSLDTSLCNSNKYIMT